MFAKLSQTAEQLATNVSRRQFLGRFGRGAITLAAVVGGFLAFPGESSAGRRRCPPGTCLCPFGPPYRCASRCCGR